MELDGVGLYHLLSPNLPSEVSLGLRSGCDRDELLADRLAATSSGPRAMRLALGLLMSIMKAGKNAIRRRVHESSGRYLRITSGRCEGAGYELLSSCLDHGFRRLHCRERGRRSTASGVSSKDLRTSSHAFMWLR